MAGAALSQGEVQFSRQALHLRKVKVKYRCCDRRSTFARLGAEREKERERERERETEREREREREREIERERGGDRQIDRLIDM